MANNPGVSEVVDKDGVIADIEAKRFDGTRTFTLQGDVNGTQTWNGDSSTAMTLNVSIGAKKVTTDKINDKAVGTAQLDDDAVTLDKIADAAMNGTVQDNDSKLATHSSVKTYVDSMISGQGTYLGKKTVAEVNAMVTANLHNGDRVMLSDSGTINLGPGGVGFDVRVGADLILYSVGSDTHWDLMDGEFKTKQTAISGGQGSTTKTLTGIGQNANGEIDPTFSDIQNASTSQKGLVQLAGSVGATVTSENNKAASEKAVRDALDALESDIQSGYKPKQTAVTDPDASGSSYSFIASYSQDANGVSTVEKKTIPDVSPSKSGVGGAKGLMSASDKEKLDDLASGEATKDKDEVIAAALDDLDARMGAVEDTLKEENLGTRTADEIDSQVLKIGGDDVATSLSSKVKSVKMVNSSGTELKDANGNVVIPLAVATGTTGATAGVMSADDKKSINDLKTGAVTDVKYVANQSGGGGSLKKTVNGTDSVVMDFMTDAEVDALFDNAMAAAIAAA
jgi:hypothetical protein